jgi:hypothetical protein
MKRIFLVLASLTGAALLVTFAVGVASKLRGAAETGSSLYMLHYFLGLFGVILGPLAVHCLIFIYFLGTGRWVKEVALAYDLPDEPWPKLTRVLKRRTFPVALAAMLVSIAAAAAGLGAQMHHWPWQIHLTLGILTLIVNGWAFVVEYRNVGLNAEAIDAVYTEVDRIRAERGLPTSAEAYGQDQG